MVQVVDDKSLNSKLHRFARMVFQDLYVNVNAKSENPPVSVAVGGWIFLLGESNAGSLALACAGVEAFGRVVRGKSCENERGISPESFECFVEKFFPKQYERKGSEIYKSYRCGLLHSSYLGYGSKDGFFPVRGNPEKHLKYTDISGNTCVAKSTSTCSRLILDIDTFVADFKKAVECYLNALHIKKTVSFRRESIDLASNLAKALESFPEDDAELLKSNYGKDMGGRFGSVSVVDTSTSYPIDRERSP